jgi:hypothetical protein
MSICWHLFYCCAVDIQHAIKVRNNKVFNKAAKTSSDIEIPTELQYQSMKKRIHFYAIVQVGLWLKCCIKECSQRVFHMFKLQSLGPLLKATRVLVD